MNQKTSAFPGEYSSFPQYWRWQKQRPNPQIAPLAPLALPLLSIEKVHLLAPAQLPKPSNAKHPLRMMMLWNLLLPPAVERLMAAMKTKCRP